MKNLTLLLIRLRLSTLTILHMFRSKCKASYAGQALIVTLMICNSALEAQSLVRRAAQQLAPGKLTSTLLKPAHWVAQTSFYKKHPWLVNTAGIIMAGMVAKKAYTAGTQRYAKYTKKVHTQRELDFIHAAIMGNANKVKALLRKGVNVNYQDAQGYTALMRVAATTPTQYYRDSNTITAFDDTFKALGEAHANLELKNAEGDTALLLAVRTKNTRIEERLITA